MKKPLLIVIIVLVVILALPVINFLRWSFQAKKPMDVIVLDKTVPTLERINHKSFFWVLTNERFVKSNKSSFSFRKDYYGFIPKRPLREKLYDQKNLRLADIMKVCDKSDALYYTDTYGVFFNDWYKGINKSRRSRKLYGGLNNVDFLYLFEMQKRNKLCILEYNTFDYPTPDLERYKTKAALGIEFNGWTGKYFASLDTAAKENEDFPIWMTAMFRKQYRKPWSFNKAGVVLLKGSEIVVLEEGKQLKSAIPVISTSADNSRKFGVIDKVGFGGWFDIIDAKRETVISNYNLETTAQGDTLLAEYSLSRSFPAVITDTINHRNWYFCGDFAANKVDYWTARFKGLGGIKGISYSDAENDVRRFFWLYYKPLIKTIFTDYYKSVKK
ncbi:MAG TPA: hypothetical protein VMT63_14665 [Bacteroidales bacterium]|nr:hypothetical protein [Bacteroidales bacterium]